MAARGLGKGLDALIPQETVPVKKTSGKTNTKKGTYIGCKSVCTKP